MVKEKIKGQSVINQPAGHVENGETATEAIIRETQEETGWQVKPESIIGFYPFTPKNRTTTYHRVCFLCSAVQQISEELDKDIDEALWLTEEEAMALPHRSPLVKQCIEDYKSGTTFPLSLFCDTYL